MKIIGSSIGGYIIDATKNEIINLIGYYGQYDMEKHEKSLSIGDEINISGMYEQLYGLSSNHNEIVRVQDILRKCIKCLDEVLPIVNADVRPSE